MFSLNMFVYVMAQLSFPTHTLCEKSCVQIGFQAFWFQRTLQNSCHYGSSPHARTQFTQCECVVYLVKLVNVFFWQDVVDNMVCKLNQAIMMWTSFWLWGCAGASLSLEPSFLTGHSSLYTLCFICVWCLSTFTLTWQLHSGNCILTTGNCILTTGLLILLLVCIGNKPPTLSTATTTTTTPSTTNHFLLRVWKIRFRCRRGAAISHDHHSMCFWLDSLHRTLKNTDGWVFNGNNFNKIRCSQKNVDSCLMLVASCLIGKCQQQDAVGSHFDETVHKFKKMFKHLWKCISWIFKFKFQQEILKKFRKASTTTFKAPKRRVMTNVRFQKSRPRLFSKETWRQRITPQKDTLTVERAHNATLNVDACILNWTVLFLATFSILKVSRD